MKPVGGAKIPWSTKQDYRGVGEPLASSPDERQKN